jgi:hypothetical protein
MSSPDANDKVDHPHPIWWALVLGGLTILAWQGFSAPFYAWWTGHINPLPGQSFMRWLFIACAPIHIFEAIYCYRLARRLGLRRSAAGWSAQTFFLGFPSTRLLRKRLAAAAPC